MIYGIPLFRKRVAPRCTIADSILLIRVIRDRVTSRKYLPMKEKSWIDLMKVLNDNKVDTLICGGINTEHRQLSRDSGIAIIENVVSSDEEIMNAIKNNTLRPGFGFKESSKKLTESTKEKEAGKIPWLLHNSDCLDCPNQQCLDGKKCALASQLAFMEESKEPKQILDIPGGYGGYRWKYAWSSDSKELVVISESEISAISIANGSSRKIADMEELALDRAYGITRSPDGKYFAFTGLKMAKDKAFRIFVISNEGGNAVELASDDHGDKSGLHWSPDGRWLSYASDGWIKIRPEGIMWEADLPEFLKK